MLAAKNIRSIKFFVFIIIFLVACPLFSEENIAQLKNVDSFAQQVAQAKFSGKAASVLLGTSLFLKSADAQMHGNYQTALALLQYTIELSPHDEYLNMKLSTLLILNGAQKEAKTILEAAYLESHKKNAETGLILAGVYVTLGMKDKARSIYQNIINTNTNTIEACSFFAKFYTVEKNIIPKDQELLAICEKKNKNDPAFSYYRGLKELALNHNPRAEALFIKSLKIDPSFSEAVLALGDMYEKKLDFSSAVKNYKNFLETRGNNTNLTVLSKIASGLISMRNNVAAIPYLETLSLLDKTDLNLKSRLALLYSDSERYQEAFSLFNEVLDAVPDSFKIIYYLGLINQKIYHYKEAILFFNRVPESSEFYGDARLQVKKISGVLSTHEASLQPKKEKLGDYR